MPTTTSKKKRSRQDGEDEDEESVDESKPSSKKQNTSKTPLKKSTTSPAPATASSTTPLKMANPTASSNARALEPIKETADTLVPPPASATKSISTSKAKSAPQPKPVLVEPTTTNGKDTLVDEEGAGTPDGRLSRRMGGRFTAVLMLLLTIVTGLWMFDRFSTSMIIGGLTQELQNCQALQSKERMQDEYYIKELETQVRGWRQDAKAKDVELRALREQCHGA